MSMHSGRHVMIPLWIALVALGAFLLPAGALSRSLLFLVLGLTVPAMIYLLWPAPALQRVGIRRQRTDAQRTT